MMREPSGWRVSSTSGEKNRTGRKGASSTDRRSLSVLNVRSLIEAILGRKGCAKLLFGMEGQRLSRYRSRGEKVKRRVIASSNRAAKRDDRLSIDVYDEPGHLIRRAQQIAVSMFHTTMRNGVTPIQYCVLRVLQDHPGIDQVTLARLCALDTSTAADLAVRLEERGLVRRMMPMKSKRHRLLQLTPEGSALVKRLLSNAYVLSRRLLRALNKKEQRIFLRLLRKFVHLNNQESRAPLDRRFSRSRNNITNSRAKPA
jgi:MarR family transcriptional regulator, temperature-dependent positive regulator of motility